jgi:hypothetical protein
MPVNTGVGNVSTRIGTEFKAVRLDFNTKIGNLGDLDTSTQVNLVAAINELVGAIGGAGATIDDGTISTVSVWSSDKTDEEITDAINGLAAVAASGDAADLTGTLPTSVLPPLAINKVDVVASQAAMLALTSERGDMAIRTDNGNTYVLSTDSPTTLADWKEVTATGDVVSVNGDTGVVVLNAADVGAQAAHGNLDALAGLTLAANKLIYGNGAGTLAVTDFTAFARTLLDDADAAAARTTLDVYSKAEIGDPNTDYVAIFEAALL